MVERHSSTVTSRSFRCVQIRRKAGSEHPEAVGVQSFSIKLPSTRCLGHTTFGIATRHFGVGSGPSSLEQDVTEGGNLVHGRLPSPCKAPSTSGIDRDPSLHPSGKRFELRSLRISES